MEAATLAVPTMREASLLSAEECRRKGGISRGTGAENDRFWARQAYEKIAQLWREMAERAERSKW